MLMTVLLILVSSILTPIFLKLLYGKDKKNLPVSGLNAGDEPVPADVEAMVKEMPAVKNLGALSDEHDEENK